MKADALRNGNRYEEAVGAYEKAIEIDPEYPEAWLGLSDALSALGRTGEAEAAHGRSEELKRSSVSPLL